MLKRLGIILGAFLLLLLLVVFFSTSFVERESYFDEDYYKETAARIDSLKPVTETDSVQAGFARVNITPTLNSTADNYQEGKFIQVPLSGYGARKGKYATGIHDSIFVKAAALKVGSQTVVFVGADLLIMPPGVIDSVTVLLSKKGIRRGQVFYSASHTHSSLGAWGPGYVGEQFAGKENINIERWLTQQISAVVIAALADLKPARISTGNFAIDRYTNNRLIGKTGDKNNDFSFIALEQKGHKKAIIGSYSAHATTLGADNLEISADYPGYWQRKMEASAFDYAVFFAGSVGSQGPSGEGEGFDKPKFIGEGLADSLKGQLSNRVFKDTITFSSLSLKIQLPEYHIRLTKEINLATPVSQKLLPFQDDTYLQAVRLGNMIWITTPCDFSGEFALQLKNSLAAYRFDANVSSFNGGYVGYIVPGRYFYLDKYEPKVMGWFGPNMGEYTMDLIRQVARIISGKDNI
ncbi:neutral/alkaline non-lysosomal ceramidase N-terminal domain-containing protein [Flavihumibacter profundi]|uniref:neutral/alkaline non-lysosomal ceramidase N-terminal domain-containing protein n=1 Tax=Flavihumibacter profundi TaxID=2716883 RepID=UPI001CC46A00|nr:neutral/alkaline non-lysosomal ceramidase N-terminal domain-containing protein [Flavihumibacter profundi]MBZ5857298.1 neutral/alkaline non-lysosomal ceramidase N-terminal domain-containing protein [Flavihumibacter profundi]